MHQGDIWGNGNVWIQNRFKGLSHQKVYCTGVVLWFMLFLLLPLQPCTILNHKHFVGTCQYIKICQVLTTLHNGKLSKT